MLPENESQDPENVFLVPEVPYGENTEYTVNNEQCPEKKPKIKNASMDCSPDVDTHVCIVHCMDNYELANGKTSAKLLCNTGVWTLEGFENDDKPACERKIEKINE